MNVLKRKATRENNIIIKKTEPLVLEIRCGGYATQTLQQGDFYSSISTWIVDVCQSIDIPQDRFIAFEIPGLFYVTDTAHQREETKKTMRKYPEQILNIVNKCLSEFVRKYGEFPHIVKTSASALGGLGHPVALGLASALRAILPKSVVILDVYFPGDPGRWERKLVENASEAFFELKEIPYPDSKRIWDSGIIQKKISPHAPYLESIKSLGLLEKTAERVLWRSVLPEGFIPSSQIEDIKQTYRNMRGGFTALQVGEVQLDKKLGASVWKYTDMAIRRAYGARSFSWELPKEEKVHLGLGLNGPSNFLNVQNVSDIIRVIKKEEGKDFDGFTTLSLSDQQKVLVAMEIRAEPSKSFYDRNIIVDEREVDIEVYDVVYEVAEGWW
jgi:hypothetical protein